MTLQWLQTKAVPLPDFSGSGTGGQGIGSFVAEGGGIRQTADAEGVQDE